MSFDALGICRDCGTHKSDHGDITHTQEADMEGTWKVIQYRRGTKLYATTSKQHGADCTCPRIASWTGHEELADTYTHEEAVAEARQRGADGHYMRGYVLATVRATP